MKLFYSVLVLIGLCFILGVPGSEVSAAEDSNISLETNSDEFNVQSSNYQKMIASWGSTRSTASYQRTTSKNTKIYHKGGGLSRARTDFQNTGTGTIRTTVNSSGNRVDTKATSAGTMTLYTSKGKQPTLSFLRDKIRYFGS